MGAGDAYWYTIMLADFVAQLRHSGLPVWVGQSVFGYNGAISPLRLAPWFQHLGGLVDLASAERLDPAALKNAVLCVNGFAIVGSAYFCLRAVLPRRPGLACMLALLWLASPGVLAPVFFGDQYMTFVAMPFLPPLLLGCRRLWTEDDGWARFLIVVGVSGLWLSHTPIALWGSLLGAGMYGAQALSRRQWGPESVRAIAMVALFAVLGAFPIGSALTINEPAAMTLSGAQVPPEIAGAFPNNFKPFNEHTRLGGYQLGYSLLAVGIAALGLLLWLRPRGGLPFVATMLLLAPITLPVPGVTSWFWLHVPSLFVNVQNIWPMQRIFTIWTLVIAFAFAIAAAMPAISGQRGRALGLLAALAAGGVWSGYEVTLFIKSVNYTFVDAAETNVLLRPENLRLTRYPYASFATAPSYASHGYVEPALENRLLDRRTGAILKTNADAAAPPAGEPALAGQLVQSGLWRATSVGQNKIYTLSPSFTLEPGRHYALRLDFVRPDREGVLQILSPGLFREYILPDSGGGVGVQRLPRALGSLPTSGHVIPLLHHDAAADIPILQFVTGAYTQDSYDFAQFRLYEYDPAKLPVRVDSWIPYKADVEAPAPSFLESPRVWQRGWRAQVNGRWVKAERSAENLVMVPVAPGHNRVILTFAPALWLSAWYWLAVAGWVVVFGLGIGRVLRAALRDIRV